MVKTLTLTMLFAPLVAAIITGLRCRTISRFFVNIICMSALTLSLISAVYLYTATATAHNIYLYHWLNIAFGLLVDKLSLTLSLLTITLTWLINIYSMRYMRDDPGYARFFAYMALFVFFMLLLLLANNLLLLFIGWEGVGLCSYLLISFWFGKKSAVFGGVKAFIVNRVADTGFVLGIIALFYYAGPVSYPELFIKLHHFSPIMVNTIGIFLLIGAMGKSAQLPFHVWLPASMEGPTPISALIHAATMVTAGVYLLLRLAPLFAMSLLLRDLILIVGATSALFLGILALMQFDIKRILVYSTMSQLGFMFAGCGILAFSSSLHLVINHALFKALLFLVAGSLSIALNGEQDIRKMGNLWRTMPILFGCFLIGAIAMSLGGVAKGHIIVSTLQGGSWVTLYAGTCLLLGAFVTALYSFRALFLIFLPSHSALDAGSKSSRSVQYSVDSTVKPRNDNNWLQSSKLNWQIFLPLTVLVVGLLIINIHTPIFSLDMLTTILGAFAAWLIYIYYQIDKIPFVNYGFDRFNNIVFVNGIKHLGNSCYQLIDTYFINDLLIKGISRQTMRGAKWLRKTQTGFLGHYAFLALIILLILMLRL
ncbi:MAG: NADH-quinone oxidoreductase subunit L [Gammaproteobacteria bacterium]|nr:NADH-quinone oxidoreductase subunit L [Gammaproteobacteria bacterium]